MRPRRRSCASRENSVSPLHRLPPFLRATRKRKVQPRCCTNNWYQSLHGLRPWSMAMPCVRGARRPRRTCVVAQRLRWRGVARRRGGEAVRAAGEAARAATLLASGRGMCVSRGRADHRRRTRPAERRTAASITSVRDRVREPGRAGRGVIEELGVRRRGARRVSPVEKKRDGIKGVCAPRRLCVGTLGVCHRRS